MQNKGIFWASATFLITMAILYKKFRKPVEGKITSKFGYRIHPITKASTFHNGIDIAIPVGTKIYAPASGVVESVFTNDAGGLQMKIKHNNGFITGYAHLSRAIYPVGTKIRKSQIIAYSGKSGQVTGPHLHFTLTNPEGEKVDPEKYIYKA